MKHYSERAKQGVTFLLIFCIVFSFIATPKQASAIDVSGLGATIMGCTNIGDTIVDFVTELGQNKTDTSDGSAYRDRLVAAAGNTSVVKVYDAQVETIQKKAAERAKKAADSQERTTKCLNGIAWAASKAALSTMTQKTVNWANTGLSGNPLYVTDSKSYFKDLKTRELNVFINDLSSAGNAYGQQISKELIQKEQQKNLASLRTDQRQKTGCTSQEFEENFNCGGWKGFLNYNLNSANNPLGSRFAVQQKLSEQQAIAVDSAKDELVWNNGFLNIKKCADKPSPNAATTGTETGPTAALISNKKTCHTFETQTPGIIIQNQLSLALGTPTRLLENADQINETLGAVFDSLINNLFNKGLADLGKAQQEAGYGYGTSNGFFQGDIYGGSNISTLGGGATGSLYNYETSWFGINGDFDIRDMKQFDLIIKTQHDYMDAMNDSLPYLDKVIWPIAKLDQCIPGPNPAWQEDTPIKINGFIDTLLSSSDEVLSPAEVQAKVYKALQIAGGITTNFGPIGQGLGLILNVTAQTLSHWSQLKADVANAQANAEYVALVQELPLNKNRVITGFIVSGDSYNNRLNQAYPIDGSHALDVADEASPIVTNLRNYDDNITALKLQYYHRKQDTSLIISRLNDMRSHLGPLVQAGRMQAATWNIRNCPQIAPNPGDVGLDPSIDLTGTGLGGTDAGGGVVSTGPGGGTGTGVDTGGTGAGTGTGGN